MIVIEIVIYLWEWREWLMLVNFFFIVQQIWTTETETDFTVKATLLWRKIRTCRSLNKQNTTNRLIPLWSLPFIAVTWASCATKQQNKDQKMIFSVRETNHYRTTFSHLFIHVCGRQGVFKSSRKCGFSLWFDSFDEWKTDLDGSC